MRWDDATKNLVASMWKQGYDPTLIQAAVNRYQEDKGAPANRSFGAVLLQLEKMGYLPKGSCKLRKKWLASRRR